MSERLLSPTAHVIVLLALVLMTVLTVAVSFLPLAGAWHIVLGLSIAAVKASLVLVFFMHVLRSPPVTWAVIVAALAGFSILILLTYSDYLSRAGAAVLTGH
jgi:cytochrome c oxidase subunit IV